MKKIATTDEIQKKFGKLNLSFIRKGVRPSDVPFYDEFRQYCKENSQRYTIDEIQALIEDYLKFLMSMNAQNQSSTNTITVADGIVDFLYNIGKRNIPREYLFRNNIINNYPVEKIKKVLDVGAGRLCKLSQFLMEHGYSVTAMDPNIRLTDGEIEGLQLQEDFFECDEFAENEKGTDISEYDLIIGMEPCEATEHIIRQCLKYCKPFEIALCATAHDGLDGEKFKDQQEWYKHLQGLGESIRIEILGDNETVIYDSEQRKKARENDTLEKCDDE